MKKVEFVEKRMQLERTLTETKAQMIGDLVVEQIGEPVPRLRVTHEPEQPSKWRVSVSLPKHTLFTSYSLKKLEAAIQEHLDDKYLSVVVGLGDNGCIQFTVFFN